MPDAEERRPPAWLPVEVSFIPERAKLGAVVRLLNATSKAYPIVAMEPILLALRWLGVEMRRLWVPLAVANVLSAFLYYYLVKAGWVSVDAWL